MTSQLEHSTLVHDTSALTNRIVLRAAHVLSVQLCGSPGSGKTALLEATVRQLRPRARMGAIIAHRAASRDVSQLRHVMHAVPCDMPHVSPQAVHQALGQFDLQDLDILFIEAPDDEPIDLGENARVALFSVTGGDDKAVEFPLRVSGADLVLLNKTDLLPMVKFDPRVFRSDVIQINRAAELIELSARDGSGMEQWTNWLLDRWHVMEYENPSTPSMPEWWFG